MKNKITFPALVLSLLIGFLSTVQIFAQNPLPEILHRMEAHQKALKSLKADVFMEQFNSQLQETDVTEGRMMYVPMPGKDALVRIDWTKPRQEILSSYNGEYILYNPQLKQAYTGKTKNATSKGRSGEVFSFMNMSRAQLGANYTVRFMGSETLAGGVETLHIDLKPKNAQSYKLADLWIDADGMVRMVKVTEANNDLRTVRLLNIQKNVTIATKDFVVKMLKDTNIIKT